MAIEPMLQGKFPAMVLFVEEDQNIYKWFHLYIYIIDSNTFG